MRLLIGSILWERFGDNGTWSNSLTRMRLPFLHAKIRKANGGNSSACSTKTVVSCFLGITELSCLRISRIIRADLGQLITRLVRNLVQMVESIGHVRSSLP